MSTTVTNCISIDVEGFVESNVLSLPIPERYRDRKRENRELEENVDVFLELLDEAGARATFFFLGRIAEDLPHVVWRDGGAGTRDRLS